MTPQAENNSNLRGRRRSHNACLPCRRKKTRCPGEKPACSTCTRLNQPCSYAPVIKNSRSGHSEERLANLEEKLDRILNGNLPAYTPAPRRPSKDVSDISEESYSPSPAPERSTPASQANTDSTSGRPRPDQVDIARGIRTYFNHCHRQPIWCFEREDVTNFAALPDELVYSILALTSHFSPRQNNQTSNYGNDARHLIMLRIANGAVSLSTIESLCLLSYSTFMDGNPHLGQFNLGLAIQLCRSAMLDVESLYTGSDPSLERKKKLFWSLQLLEHFYGRPNGMPSIPVEIGRPSYGPAGGVHGLFSDLGPKTPPLPTDSLGTSTTDEPGIWNTGLRLGWVWSRVRRYVSDCSQNILKEPWRHDSTYAMVCSDFLETENRIPICHRYDSVKFYERKIDELRNNHDYWAAWLKEQFTYHAIPTVLNHPFLYIVGAQHNPNLAIPNTFWRRSSELALIHATWIVRIIDMIVDRQVQLTDPFFAHMAAIAATVHLYYCCAAAARLKHKSHNDFAKCRRFLKSFVPFSAACAALDLNLDRMTRIAADSDSMDVEDWMPSKLNLSVPLMWDILQFNCMTVSPINPSVDLLDASLTPAMSQEDFSECSLLEIVVATSPEITVDTTDGGQRAPLASSSTTKPDTPRNMVWTETNLEPTDNLTFNTTPWLYADLSQFASLGDLGLLQAQAQSDLNDNRTPQQPWWEGGNFSGGTFY